MIDEERGNAGPLHERSVPTVPKLPIARNAFGNAGRPDSILAMTETWIKTMDRFLVAFVSLAAWSAAAVAQEEGKAHPQAVLG